MADRSVRTLSTAAALALLAGLAPAFAEPVTYHLDPTKSEARVHVGKAGLFKFAGHEHDVVAPVREGTVVADRSDLTRSSVRLAFDAAAVRLVEEGEPPEDVPKVQQAMSGPKVLDAGRYPEITFESETVTGREASPGAFDLTVSGPLRLRDRALAVRFTVRVELAGDRLVATAKGSFKQSTFGISPISVAGVVKVKDELTLEAKFEGTQSP
jgi:polyisoprenoid-binding protein YceI